MDKAIVFSLLAFAFISCFFNSKCSPLYLFNEWCDPNIYFSIGKGMFNGEIPYKDLFDHKGPLIFLIYGIGYLISATNFLGVYILQSLFLFISILFAYKIAVLYLEKLYSFIIAISYAALIYSKSGPGGSADEFIVPAITIALYYFLLYFKNNEDISLKKLMLIQGFTFCFSFFIKFSVSVFWIPLIIATLYELIAAKQYQKALKSILYFVVGAAIIFIPFLIYFGVNNALEDFYFSYFKFNILYAGTELNIDTILNIAARFVKTTLEYYIGFPLIFIGVCAFLFTNIFTKKAVYKVAFFISFALTYLPIVNSPFHNLYAYIVLFIFAIAGLIFIIQLLSKYFKIKKSIYPAIYVASFISIMILSINLHKLFNQDIDCLLRKKECPYMQKEFAEIINRKEKPTLLDLGLDKGVYTAANIVPTYKYFFHPLISDDVFPDIKEFQIKLIREREPMFIVSTEKDFPSLLENYNIVATNESPAGNTYLLERKTDS